MAITQLKWPILGVLIPSIIIAILAYGSHIAIFRHYFTTRGQIVFEMLVTMIWLSYYLAIMTPPGSPPPNFQYDEGRLVWSKWCKKCANYKPERCHHCKSCKTCILKMDHHCPWTMNCVGYENLPHFLRFLIWVEGTTGYALYQFSFKIIEIYQNRNLPAYLFSITELSFVILFTLLDFLVFFTITILLGRVISNHFFSGMTQIEIWEYERLESQMKSKRLWKQINKNYYQLYGKNLKFDKLVSANNHGTIEMEDDEEDEYELRDLQLEPELEINDIPRQFTVDDIIFPYDISIWQNIYNTIGPIYLFWWPWAKPPHTKEQNGIVFQIDPDFKELDQLNLPWPPDGGDQLVPSSAEVEYISTVQTGMHSTARVRVIDPRLKLKRTEWFNDFGEKLSDFGVDLDAEDDDDTTTTTIAQSTSSSPRQI